MRLSWKYLLGLTLASSPASLVAKANSTTEEWLVRTNVTRPSAAQLANDLGVGVEDVELVFENLYKIRVSTSDVQTLRRSGDPLALVRQRLSFRKSSLIQRVQRNHRYKIALDVNAAAQRAAAALNPSVAVVDNPAIQPPNANPARGLDPKAADQWGLANSMAREAWAMQTGSPEMIVAVIDTGVDYNHEDLRNNMWRNAGEVAGNNIDDDNNGFVDDVVGYDFADNDSLPFDKMSSVRISGNPGHGTHCAGVVGGVGQNALGISGVAPNVRIMALRFLTDAGQGTSADAARAIAYAVQNGAKVLSNSWGGEEGDEDDVELKEAIANAEQQGVLMIFAAGNGRNGVGYDNDNDPKPAVPASYDNENIISVAAIDVNNARGVFSNWGLRSVDLGAPGVRIMSSVPGNNYEAQISIFGIPLADWSGTSMATPHVAGAAALVWSQFPDADYIEVKRRLLESVTPINALAGKTVTGGTLNVLRALQP